MSSRILARAVLTALLISSFSGACLCEDFLSTGLGQKLLNLGIDFVSDPGDFLMDIQNDTEDFTPVPKTRTVALQTGFFPTLFPLTIGGISIKAKVFEEQRSIPEISLNGGYWSMVALSVASQSLDDVDAACSGWDMGLVFTSSLDKKTRIFWGGKYSKVKLRVELADPVYPFGEEEGADFKIEDMDIKAFDTSVFAGLEFQTREDKLILASLGYGLKYDKIVCRIIMRYNHWDVGLALYPEGLFVIHPVLNLHWYF